MKLKTDQIIRDIIVLFVYSLPIIIYALIYIYYDYLRLFILFPFDGEEYGVKAVNSLFTLTLFAFVIGFFIDMSEKISSLIAYIKENYFISEELNKTDKG